MSESTTHMIQDDDPDHDDWRPRGSWASSPASRAVMRGNRSRNTKPELALRTLLHARGLRYLVDARPMQEFRIRADLLFRGAKVAVFVDGCYWHGCAAHGTFPKSNAEYWADKIERNKRRDKQTNELLTNAGWAVIRFWEHDDPVTAADITEQLVRHRKRSG